MSRMVETTSKTWEILRVLALKNKEMSSKELAEEVGIRYSQIQPRLKLHLARTNIKMRVEHIMDETNNNNSKKIPRKKQYFSMRPKFRQYVLNTLGEEVNDERDE